MLDTAQCSSLFFGALSLQRLDIAQCRLVLQILQSASVVQTALNLRNKLLRNVNRNATSLRAIVQHIALMLFARQTSRAIRATHRLRRKLSEPRNAGHSTAASLCSQRMTSDADSESICSMPNKCPQTHGHIDKMQREKSQETRYFKGSIAFRDRN